VTSQWGGSENGFTRPKRRRPQRRKPQLTKQGEKNALSGSKTTCGRKKTQAEGIQKELTGKPEVALKRGKKK